MANLRKVLGYRTLLLITINAIIGSGIYFLPALGAQYAGPASILSWLILASITMYIAAAFSELVSMYPKAGGVYEFSKQTYGRFTSFIIGWVAWLEGNITTAMLIVGAIQYLLPHDFFYMKIIKIAICLLWVFIFNLMAYRGMKTSAVMLVTFAIITVSMIFVISVPSLFHFDIANFQPFFIEQGFLANASAIFLAVFFISETFFGLESVSYLAEETKDPQKIMPKAFIRGTGLVVLLALILVVTSLGALNWEVFGSFSAPFAEVARMVIGPFGHTFVTLGTYVVIMGAAAGWIVTSPRLILALTRDKLFFNQFKDIHPKYNSPHKAIIFQALITALFIILSFNGGYKTLLSLLVPLVIIMLCSVLMSVVILRYKKPEAERHFRAPFGKVLPIIVIALLLLLVCMWVYLEPGAMHMFQLVISFILFGIPIYLLMEMYYDPRLITEVHDIFAYFALLTERINLPKGVRHEIIHLLGNIKDKKVLEFGCSVGTLTLQIAESVGPQGTVYATDISRRELAITRKRLDKLGYKHVKVLHDPQHSSRVHPNVKDIDVVVSAGMIGYIQDLENVLLELNKRMKKGNKICILEFDKFFDIIPNAGWLSDTKRIKSVFRDMGFNVGVIRKQGFAWQYIYIYGIKYRDV